MRVDVLIVGAGIQGLILAHILKKEGFSISCITNEPIGGKQTLRSQFYLHRGHFYREPDLAYMLNQTYSQWTSLIQDMDLQITENQSYIGFNCSYDENMWLNAWIQASIPFEKVKKLPTILQQSQGSAFYQFPHILFSGQELLHKLTEELSSFFIVGNVEKIDKQPDELYDVHINNQNHKEIIKATHIVLCAGSGNNDLIELIDVEDKNIPNAQKRFCQVLVLEGNLPNLSILLPGLKMFIAPQYYDKKVYWLYTFDTDPLILSDIEMYDKSRLEQQIQELFNFFPLLSTLCKEKACVYTATKIESADLGKGSRPNKAYVHSVTKRILAVWPTKLSLAFEAANEVLNHVISFNSLKKETLPTEGNQFFWSESNKQIELSLYLNRK